MDLTKKIIVCLELFTLIMLWVCALTLYTSTELFWVYIVSGITISFGSLGTGFILYEIIKEWKSIESSKT